MGIENAPPQPCSLGLVHDFLLQAARTGDPNDMLLALAGANSYDAVNQTRVGEEVVRKVMGFSGRELVKPPVDHPSTMWLVKSASQRNGMLMREVGLALGTTLGPRVVTGKLLTETRPDIFLLTSNKPDTETSVGTLNLAELLGISLDYSCEAQPGLPYVVAAAGNPLQMKNFLKANLAFRTAA